MPFRDSDTGEYPISHEQIRAANPNVSYPAYFEAAAGYDWVVVAEPPAYNALTQYLEAGLPMQVLGVWKQAWIVKDFDATAIAQRVAAQQQVLIRAITDATQSRLDVFSRTRNYDDILSACTYATSSNPKFKAEGQYCVDVRDATWAKLYAIMADAEQGKRPVPTGYDDIKDELPALVWPV